MIKSDDLLRSWVAILEEHNKARGRRKWQLWFSLQEAGGPSPSLLRLFAKGQYRLGRYAREATERAILRLAREWKVTLPEPAQQEVTADV